MMENLSAEDKVPNGQAGRRNSEDEEKNKITPPTIIVNQSKESIEPKKDVLIPRRLSKLFYPEKDDSSPEEKDNNNETEETLLLESPLIKALEREQRERRASEGNKVNKITGSRKEQNNSAELVEIINSNTFESPSVTSPSSSDDESQNEKDCDHISWDDTICSNRSAYFKHYYQKNLSGINNTSPPGASASSHASLVSLIREKNKAHQKKSLEERMNKRKEDISLMILVIFLFLLIVIGISLIYHFYNLHLQELLLFKRLKFHEDGKHLILLDSGGSMDIQARLGTCLPMYSRAEDCTHYLQYFYKYNSASRVSESSKLLNGSDVNFLARRESYNEFQFNDETVCLDWANLARLQIHRATSKGDVNCYNVFWSAHIDGISMQDCMKIKSPEYGVWWGIGEINGGGFPLESIKYLPSTLLQTGNLRTHSFGKILRRTFLSSFGGLLILPDHLPASVSIEKDELCLSVSPSNFLNLHAPLSLNYTICSSPNVSSTINYLHDLVENSSMSKVFNISMQDTLRKRIINRIEYPIWVPKLINDRQNLTDENEISEESILHFVNNVIKRNQSYWGTLLLPVSWQSKIGDFSFGKKRFPNPKEFVKNLRGLGFDVALTITPLVSTDTLSFTLGTTKGYWVMQRGTSLPALINYNGVKTGTLTDFTNLEAREWFISKLKNIRREYGINRFHLDPPDSHSMPFYHQFNLDISNSDLALHSFLTTVSSVELPLSIESIISPPPLPTFVLVGGDSSDWKSLKSLIPRILSLSMLGFPLIDAGIVGGPNSTIITLGRTNATANELFIRWFQAAAFLPAFQLNIPLHIFDGATQIIIAKALHRREKVALPRLRKSAVDTLVNNTPLVYPLGMLYPSDVTAAAVGDEWILGEDLLVAPVLDESKVQRDIYIPDGLWESQLDGKLKRGPGWIRNYNVPLSDIAYFLKRYTM